MGNFTERLTKAIETGALLGPETFEALDIDGLLDQRDAEPFDHEWARIQSHVEKAVFDQQLVVETPALTRLREVAFKAVYRHTGHPELAGYVSDDFGLIGAARHAGIEDQWLNAVLNSYFRQRVPTGVLPPLEGSLVDQLR